MHALINSLNFYLCSLLPRRKIGAKMSAVPCPLGKRSSDASYCKLSVVPHIATTSVTVYLLMSYVHVITKVTCTPRLLTERMYYFCPDSSSEDEKKVGSKLSAKQPVIKNASKPAKAAAKPGQAKKDSSSSSDSSGIGIREKRIIVCVLYLRNLCFQPGCEVAFG